MGWVRTVIEAARQQGVEASLLLEAAGIPLEELQAERWPIDHITRLWHAAGTCTGDPCFGLKVGESVSPAAINVVGFALQSAATLRDAIGMVQKFQRLISDGGRFQMLAGSETTWVVYHPQQGRLAFSPYQIEAVLAAVVRMAGWITGANLRPLRVQFSQARIGPLPRYREVFGCPVDFEQAFSGLLVDNAALDRPLPQADVQLAQVHAQYTAARLAALAIESVSAGDVQQWLRLHVGPQVPRRAQAALALGVSERTLTRRLGEQGQSFEGLLDAVRKELALQAVADSRRSLADIAQSLGFAEVSPFYRAFRRWTGMPPARWRRQGGIRPAGADAAS